MPGVSPHTLLVFIVLVVLCLALASRVRKRVLGGAVSRRRRRPDPAISPHIIVDTLNLTHWFLGPGEPLTPAKIYETIDRTAPALKLRHSGRVMYVVKDRESQFNDEAARDEYKRVAERNGVYIYVAERYRDPPTGVKESAEHSARGRDDFYLAMLAYRWRCAVLTEDRLRDFASFRATIQPFHVYEFAFWREAAHREFIRPESPAFARMRKPRMVRHSDYFQK